MARLRIFGVFSYVSVKRVAALVVAFYLINTNDFFIWGKMTSAVWGCHNDRRYSDRYVIKPHLKMGSIFANGFFLSKE